eukprot:6188219-Pleurochrysis_carterae.AAC.2
MAAPGCSVAQTLCFAIWFAASLHSCVSALSCQPRCACVCLTVRTCRWRWDERARARGEPSAHRVRAGGSQQARSCKVTNLSLIHISEPTRRTPI